jgi:hypothetical protein
MKERLPMGVQHVGRSELMSRRKETAMASVHFWGSYRTCFKALLKYLKPDWEGTKLKLKRFVQRLLRPFKGQGQVLRLIARASAKAVLIGCLFSGFGGTSASLNPQDMERLESMIQIEVAGRQQELVVFDPTVKELPVLLKGFSRDVRYLVLDGKRDGLAQIQAELERNGDIRSLHLIAHGDPGEIRLGTTALNEDSLADNSDVLKAISSRMTHARDILLYSCRTGYGADGRRFVKKMRSITGVDIAASDNLTGAQSRGGDWDLEVVAGSVETPAPFVEAALQNYRAVLHTASVSTLAQLKAAIAAAENDALDDTITITSDISASVVGDFVNGNLINIAVIDGKTLTIKGGGNALDANHLGRVLYIASGTVQIESLTIRDGLLSGNGGDGSCPLYVLSPLSPGGDSFGAGIYNSGILTILDSTITNNVATGGGGGGNGREGLTLDTTGYGGGGGSGFGVIGGGDGGYGNGWKSDGGGAPGAGGAGGGGGGVYAASGSIGGLSAYATRGGGNGGTGAGGGAGGLAAVAASSTGGNGGTAGTAGGGGGGSNYYGDTPAYTGVGGGAGGAAVGGIYNGGTLYVARTTISANLGAGGGGGGGMTTSGAGGMGVGAVDNAGTLSYQSSSTTFSSNVGGGGYGGDGGAQATSAANINGSVASSAWTPPIANNSPTLGSLAATSVNENGTVNLTGTYSDADGSDTHELTINWGEGSPQLVALSAGTFDITHQYLDDNPTGTAADIYTIGVTLTDNNAGTDAGSATTTITNVAPSLDSLAATSVDENGTVHLTGTYSDAGTQDTHELDIDWGEGSPEIVAVSGGTFDITHQYLDDNPTGTAADVYTIDVILTDDDLGSDTGGTTTTISNVAPHDLTMSSSSVVENAGVDTTVGVFTAADVGSLDTFTYSLVAGGGDADNASFTISGDELRTSAIFDSEIKDTYSIRVGTADDDGGTYEEIFAISVSDVNEEPTLTATGSSPIFTEAGPAVGLFSAAAISAIELSQNITSMTLTITNVAGDGSEELLVVDGTNVALSDGSNVTTVANGFDCSVSLSGGTATVTITKDDTAANWQTLVDNLSYQHTGSSIDSNSRVATVTTLVDSGSNTGGNDNINDSLSVVSTIGIARAPTVTTLAATSVGTTTATGNGDITDLGLPLPTQHGVCWSVLVDPTIADSITTEGAAGSTGAFTSNITGLSAETTYHYRSYATNTAGTSYGADETFTTSAPPAVVNDDSGCHYSAGTGSSFASFVMMILVFSVWFIRRFCGLESREGRAPVA